MDRKSAMLRALARAGAACGLMLSGAAPARAADPAANGGAPLWSGFYAGGHFGFGAGAFSPGLFAPDPLSGQVAGFQVGTNAPLANGWVWGIEVDLTFTNAVTLGTGSRGPGGDGGGTAVSLARNLSLDAADRRLDGFGTLRGRIGYPVGPFLPYVTAGIAAGQTTVEAGDSARTRGHLGWTAGAGLEFPIADAWTMRAEYIYVGLAGASYVLPGATAASPLRADLQSFRLGINRQFGEGAPTFAAAPVFGDPEGWSIHGQSTVIYQGYPAIRSPYEGPRSLPGGGEARETFTNSAIIGRRLWDGGEVYFNPELLQGFGLAGTNGLGGFSNGEAQKSNFPYPRPNVSRLFLRQTFGFGGEQETVEDAPFQVAGKRDVDRLTITAGKVSVVDFFDNNAYAHDPRRDFFNWSIWNSGAFDYAADTLGLTYGAVAELNRADWTLRAGYFAVPREPNVNNFDGRILERASSVVEWEQRYALWGAAGKLRLIGWLNRANMGSYREALDFGVDIADTRRTRSKYGAVVNLEQAITADLGLFARASWNNGKTEIIAFTDIDASLSGGLALKGARWGRPDDTIGLAGAVNGLSKDHRDFLAAGGIGVLVGDGRLNYRTEQLIETYYSLALGKPATLTFNYQFVKNPAYNADRGPASIFAARLHAEF